MTRFSPLKHSAVFLLAMASATHAQDDNKQVGEEIIMGAWSNPSDCNRENAIHSTFSALNADYQNLKGECVAFDGYWYGRALFRTAKDARSDRSNVSRRLRNRRVGIYAQSELLERAPDKPLPYQFVGRVGDCETQWPGAMMVMGYCHYTGGPILLVSQATPSRSSNVH